MSELFTPGAVAVVTGAALGIGRATARRLAGMGLRVVLVDLPSEDFDAVIDEVSAMSGADAVLGAPVDVSDSSGMANLAVDVKRHFGVPALLMNNAATRTGGGVFANPADWQTCFSVNFWGVLNGVNAFAPIMLEANAPAYIVNTGSKQGITNPPGNSAYNATKAALKSYTESLQHELRSRSGCRVSAHLLIPGWTTTGKREHKPGAWLPDQVVDRMLEKLGQGSFYIVCPDGEVTEAMDQKRILWSAMDIAEDRPPLSRWHGDYADAFAAFENDGG